MRLELGYRIERARKKRMRMTKKELIVALEGIEDDDLVVIYIDKGVPEDPDDESIFVRGIVAADSYDGLGHIICMLDEPKPE